jgi:RsiW-degrading membrane proteinase PrsW (M82 family)
LREPAPPPAKPATPTTPAAPVTPAAGQPAAPAGAHAPEGAGYDQDGQFHMGFTLLGMPEEAKREIIQLGGSKAADGTTKGGIAIKKRGLYFAIFVAIMSFVGCCCTGFTVVLPGLKESRDQFLTASAFALLPTLPYLVFFKILDRNGQIPWKNYLTCFFWGASVGCGFAVVINSIGGAVIAAVAGHHEANAADAAGLTATFVAPIVEELAKGMAVLVLFLFLSDEIDNVFEGMILGAASGLGFALIENCVYDTKFLINGGAGGMLVMGAYRSVVNALIGHPIYTAMTGAGFGLARERPTGCLRFLAPPIGLLVAILMHGVWNGAAFFLSKKEYFQEHEVQLLVLNTVVIGGASAILFLVILIASAIRERRILTKYLADEIEKGFIEVDEHQGFKSLFGREKFVLGGLRFGIKGYRLRKALRVAQIELAFRKWHLESGERAKGKDVDIYLLDARTRIRDARNAINALEKRKRGPGPAPSAA